MLGLIIVEQLGDAVGHHYGNGAYFQYAPLVVLGVAECYFGVMGRRRQLACKG